MIYADVILIIAQFVAGGDVTVIFDGIYAFLSDTTKLTLVSYIDAIVIGTITIVGARSFSTALSGEYFLAGISRLV